MKRFSAQGLNVLKSIQGKIQAGTPLNDAENTVLERIRKSITNEQKRAPLKPTTAHVGKLTLRQGEELGGFLDALTAAVQRDRILLGAGSFDISLAAVFEDTVVVRDWNSGKYLRSKFTRATDGTIAFGEPEEVHQVFVSAAEAAKLGV